MNTFNMDYSKIIQIPLYNSFTMDNNILVTIMEGEFKNTEISFIKGDYEDESMNYKTLFMNNYSQQTEEVLMYIASNILLKELTKH
jgi:hypothetical protein